MSLVEHVAGTQILLRGQVSDVLTKAGLQARLTLEFAQGDGFRPLPFGLRHLPGGYYAVAARLSEIGARMRLGRAVTLRLTAEAEGYQTASTSLDLTGAQFARKAGTIPVGGVAVPTESIAAAPIVLSLALKPRPVMLAGQVLSGNQLNAPVAGARVRILGPGGKQVTTGADGRFRIDTLPLAPSLNLRVTQGTRSTTALHVIDYALPVNFITLNLPTS